MVQRVRKAVFPVGGLGTRFLPATKAMPKEMLTVVDKPLIHYAFEEAKAAGIEQFIMVTSRGKASMEDHFDYAYELLDTLKARGKTRDMAALEAWLPKPGQMVFTRQQQPLGLGHAVLCAKDVVGDEPFAVLLADDLILAQKSCLKQMVEVHAETEGSVVAIMDVPREQTKRYGILDVESDDGRLVSVKGLVEKPEPEVAPSTLSIIGRYILQPEIFAHLERTERGAGNEIQLTDGLVKLLGHKPFHGLRFEGERFDCGDKLGYLEANVAFGLARPDLSDGFRAILKKLI
ncbi:MAG TPA: UTP--glucose-1-phosphate uridylyltransferase GalU [Stellaceae bacterium]|nr:UTP--glucose-1-phosphate uridylyltransferase GalU [Stellaceae bacterium]